MRLFVAINLSAKTKDTLISLRDELYKDSVRGSFTVPENMHLTLVFLGECDAKQAADAKSVINRAVFDPFDILIERVGRFGRGGNEVIWFAGIRESKPLIDLQRDLAESFTNAGFSLDRRRFSPHITLGRRVVTDAVPRMLEPFGEVARKIDLMKSERLYGKLIYTSIHHKSAQTG